MFKFLFYVLPCFLLIPFFVLLERKVLGLIGLRLGPFKVSFAGILQSFGDAGKLFNKEINILSGFSSFFYYICSVFMIICTLMIFSLISLPCWSLTLKNSFIVVLILLSFNSFNSILAGWSTYTKFSLLGSLRTVSQLVSYEVLLYICLFFFLISYSSFDLFQIKFYVLDYFFLFSPFVSLVWFLSVLAELNRTPYDFSEGESELVSGFNVEFGSSSFTLIFLAEYGNIFFFMVFSTFLFFSGGLLCSFLLFFMVLWIRGVLPRYRFDKLMGLSWKVLVPQFGFFFVLFSLFFLNI